MRKVWQLFQQRCECIHKPWSKGFRCISTQSDRWSQPLSICCNVRSVRVMPPDRKATLFMQVVPWLCLQWELSHCGLLRLSLTLIAGLLLHHHHWGVQRQKLEIGLCDSRGAQGLSPGGLQPKSCWRGHYETKARSAEVTANEIPLLFFKSHLFIFTIKGNHI